MRMQTGPLSDNKDEASAWKNVETVRYAPGQCVLMIGPAETLLARREAVHALGLKASLLCTAPDDAARLPKGLYALAGQLATLDGWMGSFRASLKTVSGPADMSPLSLREDGHFDWVLDFSGAGFTDRAVTPPGYYRVPPKDHAVFKQSLLEIARRTRDGYEKPKYFDFKAEICAHQRQSVSGCSNCLSVCAAWAIRGAKESIEIEPHLCQGCAACMLVCPSGAIRYVHPGIKANLNRLASLLAVRLQIGGQAPGLWIVPETVSPTPPASWLLFPVTNPLSLGLEFWLAALALGCGRVAIDPGATHEQSRLALAGQVSLARDLLQGMGYAPAIDLAIDAEGLERIACLPNRPAGVLPTSDDKREILFAALDALAEQAADVSGILQASTGSPVGTVEVDADKCTLCASCVRLCPTGALSLPGTSSQLAFTESKCLQCGLCVNGCPEQAVSLIPRFLVSRAAREAPRVIAEAKMFECAECGKPFATQAMIERSRALMADHPMFQGTNARLMALCSDCRQRAMAGVTDSCTGV